MTDTATQLADFLSLAAANVALPAAIATTANARIAAHQSAWDARLAALDGTIYVNQAAGADTDTRTVAGPIQIYQAAIDRAAMARRAASPPSRSSPASCRPICAACASPRSISPSGSPCAT